MNILVRNEERVTECILIPGTDVPQENLLDHPEIKNFVGGRKIHSVSVVKPIRQGDPVMIDLDIRP